VGLLSIAGSQRRTEAKGLWWAAVPQQNWPRHREFRRLLDRHWNTTWGDRRQELVFIGADLEEGAIRSALDACLIGPESGFDPQLARDLRDPFPSWQQAHVEQTHAA